ncbi:MAG: glutaredoxin 3 [Colwellia sp.]
MVIVEIYTKAYCPFCVRAMALLAHKSLEYKEIKIDADSALRNVMIKRSGGYTVPQIFINNKSIGGCDELVALEMNNQLQALLETN